LIERRDRVDGAALVPIEQDEADRDEKDAQQRADEAPGQALPQPLVVTSVTLSPSPSSEVMLSTSPSPEATLAALLWP
jgi:hypothetical protein